MKKKYRNNELNITKGNKEFFHEIIVFPIPNFVESKIISHSDEEVEIEYRIPTGSKKLEELKKAFYQDKLRFALNMIDVLAEQKDYIEWDFSEENLRILNNLKPIIIAKKLRRQEKESEVEIVDKVKTLLAYMFLDISFDDAQRTDENILSKHRMLKNFRGINNIEDLKKEIGDAVDKLEEQYTKEKIISKKSLKYSKRIQIILIILTFIFVGSTLYYGVYQLNFKEKEVNAGEFYERKEYSKVVDQMRGTNLKRMDLITKYETAYSSVMVDNDLSQRQKDNILKDLSINTEESILDYWVLVGQGNYSEAYSKAVLLNDLDLQAFALIEEKSLLDVDNRMSSNEKETRRQEYDTKIKSIKEERSKQKEEANNNQK